MHVETFTTTLQKQEALLARFNAFLHLPANENVYAYLQFAAFHPIFWLHHCNVDRIYEKYLKIEGVNECKQEFAAQQRMLHERGDVNRWERQLEPFKHPGAVRILRSRWDARARAHTHTHTHHSHFFLWHSNWRRFYVRRHLQHDCSGLQVRHTARHAPPANGGDADVRDVRRLVSDSI